MLNIIQNKDDELIGFYDDIIKGYGELIDEALRLKDYAEVKNLAEQLQEINQYKDCDGLLVLSYNNGMGFSCRLKYINSENLK